MTHATALCHLNDIPNHNSRGFVHQGKNIIAIRQDQALYLYLNSCPHLGLPLEWQPDQFLNIDKTLVQCNTHGALFTIDTGECISGPCVRQSLQALAFTIVDGEVFLVGDDA